MGHARSRILWLLLILALAAIGLWGDRFIIYLTMRVMVLAIFAMGYNVLFGRTGLLSFGHGAFFACGSYGLALFSIHINPHPLLCIPAGLIVAAVFSIVIGYFCVRHTEIYFAMLTLAFGMMVFSLIWNLRDITGGDDGLIGIERAPIDLGFISIPIHKPEQFFFLVLFFFALSLWLIHRILNSPFGLVLSGIRENQQRTEFAGISVRSYRLAAFVVSGVFSGLAGTLNAMLQNNTDPFSAHWSHSAEPILVNLIGGIQTFTGPLAGSAIFILLQEIIKRYTTYWMFWFGVILLVIIMGFRGGVVGVISRLWSRGSRNSSGSGGQS